MARPRIPDKKKLADALRALHRITGHDLGVIKGPQISAAHRTLLIEKGWLQEILKGWYFVSDPNAAPGDTTPFFANYWEYLGRYLSERFGAGGYCLSAEHSLLRLAAHNVIPKQVNVLLNRKMTQVQPLAHDYQLIMYPGGTADPDQAETVEIAGVRCMAAAYCLVHLSRRFFADYRNEVQIVMNALQDPAEIARLWSKNATGVGRLVGAYRNVGRSDMADGILAQLANLKLRVVETNPFVGMPVYQLGTPGKSPLYARIKLMWQQHRESVAQYAPQQRAETGSPAIYAESVERIKQYDAYHSLSIERYRVTPELIARVERDDWDPLGNLQDTQQVAAMAARGYLDAFTLVKDVAVRVYSGDVASELTRTQHQTWFQALFGPSVVAGILTPEQLVGYRRHMVFLRGSLHSPPHYDYLRDGMSAWMECLSEEPDPFVQAVLGHWMFGFIHPYMDGNGRMARFIMNILLAGGKYPWTVIKVELRDEYMQALEAASVHEDPEPFARFIAKQIEGSWDGP